MELLKICSRYGVLYDIKFNTKKSVAIIARNKEDQINLFFLAVLKVLEVVRTV